jgi:GntR family transcriptional regulator
VINFGADRAAYKQLADIVRDDIAAGRYAPTGRLPSVDGLARQYGVGDGIVEEAMILLRAEGWIETRRGQRATVRVEPERLTVWVKPGAVVRPGRRPTSEESRAWSLAFNERMTDVVYPGGGIESYPSDRYEFAVQVPDVNYVGSVGSNP